MFQGFSPETVDFLWGIRFNNEKSWFEPRKALYQECLLTPMRELAAQVQQSLNDRFPDGGFNMRVSRIYRDARRLHGKGPYKDHLWFSLFRWDHDSGERPVFWFELGPDGWSYGMGFWMARPEIMERHRARMDRDCRPMLRLANRLNKQDVFHLEGPEFARKKQAPRKELASWYNKRSLALSCEMPLTEELYTPALADVLTEGFTFLMPYYDYFAALWADGE